MDEQSQRGKVRPCRGQARSVGTRGVSAAYCPAGEGAGYSVFGRACLLCECTLVCGLLLVWKELVIAWAQQCMQRGLLPDRIHGGSSQGSWPALPAGNRHAGEAEPGRGTCGASTCWWRPRRRARPPRRCSSPCSAPSRCLLKCGRGRLGRKSELSMLTGASIMKALVTGPGGGQAASRELPQPGLGHAPTPSTPQTHPPVPEGPIYFPLAGPASQHPARWWGVDKRQSHPAYSLLVFGPAPPLRVTVLTHCLLWMSHTRTVSSCEPESSTLPSVDTDRQVTWFLGTQL